jgi:toxin ParE1/3/4
VVARPRTVEWAEAAVSALSEVLQDLAPESPAGAGRILARAIETAESLRTLAERGRVVPEAADPGLRELFVFKYRLLYRVYDERVVVTGFLHGARDFAKWRQEQRSAP